jgi:hypothetical protein
MKYKEKYVVLSKSSSAGTDDLVRWSPAWKQQIQHAEEGHLAPKLASKLHFVGLKMLPLMEDLMNC